MVTVHVARLDITPDRDHGLGRHVVHDDQSRGFEFHSAAQLPTVPVHWAITTPVLNQLDYQSCVGQAFAQFLNTDYAKPVRDKLKKSWFTGGDALDIYALATTLDGLHTKMSGYFPPSDNGSSGLGGVKACQQLGYIGRYTHTFSFGAFLRALARQPVVVGTLWTEGMDNPGADGVVTVGEMDSMNVLGGHEYLAIGFDPVAKLVEFLNSWGQGWGKQGRFYVPFDQYAGVLARQGDVIVPTLAA